MDETDSGDGGVEVDGEVSAEVDGEATAEVDGEAKENLTPSFEQQPEQHVAAAVEAIQQVEGIRPENWQNLDGNERLGALQHVESQMAELQGRPSVPVVAEQLSPNIFGGYDGHGITINSDHLSSNMPIDEFVDTIVHEGRHAFQDFAVNNPGVVADTALVNAWAENQTNYLDSEEYGQELYMGQPLESDAWSYAGQVVDSLRQTRI